MANVTSCAVLSSNVRSSICQYRQHNWMAVAVATSHSLDVKMNTSEAAALREVTCAHYASLCVVRVLVKQTDRQTYRRYSNTLRMAS
jgi:hypothetical protein